MAVLFIIACCGVAIHAKLSHSLAFFNFNAKFPPTGKGTFSRIFIPWLFVVICSAATPFLITHFNSDLHEFLWIREDLDDLILFMDPPWFYFLPIKGVDLFAIPICAGTGTIFYFISGFSLLGVWKLCVR